MQLMKSLRTNGRGILLAAMLGSIATLEQVSHAQASAGGITNEIRSVEVQGAESLVEVSPRNATTWVRTQTNQVLYPFDRLRTGRNTRITLRWSDQSVVPVGPLTELEILPPHEAKAESGLHLIRGLLSFFHRDEP